MAKGIKRRDFLKVLGVTGAGAADRGLLHRGGERLLPYVDRSRRHHPRRRDLVHERLQECSAGCGVWVRTREGRAVKLEGNPFHPVTQGGLCTQGQASLQGLYNPDRFTGPMLRENGALRQITWDEAEAMLTQRLRRRGRQRCSSSGHMGPSLSTLFDAFVDRDGRHARRAPGRSPTRRCAKRRGSRSAGRRAALRLR